MVLDRASTALVRISLNMHGARAVQKLIDVVRTTPFVPRLVAALEGAVVALTKDPNGNHVIQRCLESLPPEAHSFIFRAVASDIIDVASHRHGCRIVQRCIDASKGHDRWLLTGAISQSSLTLVQDPFGNYVVQYILGLHDPKANSQIISCMLGRLNVLSRQKFSSNVVERCLQVSGPEDRIRMIMELSDVRSLGELLRDVYGNYVVQSALFLACEPQLTQFLGVVRPLLPSLRASGQGRRIAQKLEKKYPQLRAGGGNSSVGTTSNSSAAAHIGRANEAAAAGRSGTGNTGGAPAMVPPTQASHDGTSLIHGAGGVAFSYAATLAGDGPGGALSAAALAQQQQLQQQCCGAASLGASFGCGQLPAFPEGLQLNSQADPAQAAVQSQHFTGSSQVPAANAAGAAASARGGGGRKKGRRRDGGGQGVGGKH